MTITKLPITTNLPRPPADPQVPLSGGLRTWLLSLLRWTRELVGRLDEDHHRQVTTINQLMSEVPMGAGSVGSTKATPGTVDTWLQVTVNGTTYYVPGYLSQTS